MSRYKMAFDLENMTPAPAGTAVPRTIYRSDDGVLLCFGTTKPADAAAGYAPGCRFFDTTNGVEYVNIGSKASANFDSVAGLTKQAHVADPAACAAMTATLAGVDTGTDMTAAQAAMVVADLAACKAGIDANNAAIDSILTALESLGLVATA